MVLQGSCGGVEWRERMKKSTERKKGMAVRVRASATHSISHLCYIRVTYGVQRLKLKQTESQTFSISSKLAIDF